MAVSATVRQELVRNIFKLITFIIQIIGNGEYAHKHQNPRPDHEDEDSKLSDRGNQLLPQLRE